jgi:hypothetical protein
VWYGGFSRLVVWCRFWRARMVNLLWWFCGGARGSGGGSVPAEHM